MKRTRSGMSLSTAAIQAGGHIVATAIQNMEVDQGAPAGTRALTVGDRASIGRRRRGQLRRLVYGNITPYLLVCRRMGNMYDNANPGRAKGSIEIAQQQNAGEPNRLLPCYIMDTTMYGLNSNTGGLRNNMKRLAMNNTNGNLVWDDRFRWMVPSTGVQSHSGWHQEAPTFLDNEVQDVTSRRLMEWLKFKFVFYGTKTRPVSFIIELIKMNDEDLDPWAITHNPVSQGYWQSQIRHLTFNPQGDVPNPYANRVKTLFKKVITIQPTLNNENDPEPEIKTFTLFHRCSTVLSYLEDSVQFTPVNLTSANLIPEGAGVSVDRIATDHVNTKQKLFLVVRGTDYLTTPMAGNSDPATYNINRGSFDLVVMRSDRID